MHNNIDSEAAAMEAIRVVLKEAVRKRLLADVPNEL